ncbi:MAG: MOSC domain-containing protein [Betaproteobacteria bacterium]|nr:MOSC domain-containing protein [Betaproteobacteria bacterium]MBU6511754.1 MOSC domain-containing protein [Betaproteobacteria bacterium]MDE1954247.1 MOSC domain-containing protein [Betaproteobacteria bacterium]MDE2153298.1 MOSC domain-containing protein [Betaproteobacteria bacterium]
MSSLDAISGVGLSNDSHADALSPRQALLAGADAYELLALPEQTLRENIFVDFSTQNLPSSLLLAIGADVVLRTTFQCEPCGRLDRNHPGVLKGIGKRRGVLARVARGGRIRVGDRVRCLPAAVAALPDDWQERILQVVEHVPDNQLIEYRHLARLAGVPKVYCRVFPKILARASTAVARRAKAGHVDSHRQWFGHDFYRIEEVAALEALAIHAATA